MKKQLVNLFTPLSIIAFAAIMRLLPHPPNFAPITAMALFGGVYLNKKYALVVPLAAMFISDLFIGFHDAMIFVYGSFFLTGLIGLLAKNKKQLNTIVGATFISSLLFYIITNFGVWLVSGMYPHSFVGLIDAYVLAVPFYRNTLFGDFFYTALFFICYELIVKYIHISTNKPVPAKSKPE